MAAKTKNVKKTSASPDNNLIYALIVLALVLLLYTALKRGAYNNSYTPEQLTQQTDNNYPSINGSADLDKAVKQLDDQDLTVLDKELSGFDTDSSSL